MNLYVGNVSFSCNEDDLRDLFGEYGEVKSVRLVTDRETGRARGFGFVEMENRDSGQNAIDALNNREFGGRKLVVNEARPKPEGQSRGGGGGGYRGGGGGGGGGGGYRSDRGDSGRRESRFPRR